MNNDFYTIKRLSKELDQVRQNIRTYTNDLLEYDYDAFVKLLMNLVCQLVLLMKHRVKQTIQVKMN